MNKLAYISIGAIFTLVMSFSWYSLAANNPSTTSQEANTASSVGSTQTGSTIVGEISFIDPVTKTLSVLDGKQKTTFNVDSQTKVMINQQEGQFEQLKLGDQVELVCNSDKMVRYIVLTKEADTALSKQQSNSNGTSGSRENVVTQKNGTPNPAVKKELEDHHDQGKHKGWYKDKKKHDSNDQDENDD